MANPLHATCSQCGTTSLEGGVCAACAFSIAAERDDPGDSPLVLDDLCPRPADPEFIGRYRILQRIGEGGMGIVYKAEQQDALRRVVAVKVIRTGFDSREVVARFELERQALTLMNHPNVAQVFDAGTAMDGRPFFAMEFVEGIPITAYCDEHNLTTRERLDLFVVLCHAIQHAHQKGIIHRDLKPSNILVTTRDGVAVPKIIDFGVAKATEPRLSSVTLHTRIQQFIGTPAYMSPEQAELGSADIDTRSDIYSLGVLLYELLTGRAPFDAAKLLSCGFDEMRRIVREVEPARPSTHLSTLDAADAATLARKRRESLPSLIHHLSGDIDCIVMKALEKDRTRRYETAREMAADLARYMNNEPVLARPPSVGYQLQKLVRRHRATCAAAAAVCAALIGGAIITLWQASRARSAESRAVKALTELRAAAPTFVQQARALAAKGKFAEAVEKLDYAIQLQPDTIEYLGLKGDFLEVQLKFAEAAETFERMLTLHPGHRRAATNLFLCKRLEASRSVEAKISVRLLTGLYELMREEKRPDAELLPISTLLGREQSHLIATCLDRLQPLWPGRPLDKRISFQPNGLLQVDLESIPVSDLSPLFGLPVGAIFTGGGEMENNRLTSLDFIREFPLLNDLRVNGQWRIKEFSGLALGKRLNRLHLWGTQIKDLSYIASLPLTALTLRATQVSDLRLLAGMQLRYLDLTEVPARDFTPLTGLPLEELSLSHTRIGDLSCLRGMPLQCLRLDGCSQMYNLEVLGTLPNLKYLTLPTDIFDFPKAELTAMAKVLRSNEMLKRITIGPSPTLREMAPAERFWAAWDERFTILAALDAQGIGSARLSRQPNGTWSLNLAGAPISNLSFLPTNVAISSLGLEDTMVTSLETLAHLPLKSLDLANTKIADLSPLARMSLQSLRLSHTAISNLAPLHNTPLINLSLSGASVVDVSVLAHVRTLESIVLPRKAQNVDALRSLPRLKRISWRCTKDTEIPLQTAAEFWAEWDAQPWIQALLARGVHFSVGRWSTSWDVAVLDQDFSDASVFAGSELGLLNLSQTSVIDISPLANGRITGLSLNETKVSNLGPLTSLPLRRLYLDRTAVTNLGALRGKQLQTLHLSGTSVVDLEPLRDMPLESLTLANTLVSDLSPLTNMPLKTLFLCGCDRLNDISCLASIKTLETVLLPKEVEGIDALRALPALKHLTFRWNTLPFQTAADFWREWDATQKRKP